MIPHRYISPTPIVIINEPITLKNARHCKFYIILLLYDTDQRLCQSYLTLYYNTDYIFCLTSFIIFKLIPLLSFILSHIISYLNIYDHLHINMYKYDIIIFIDNNKICIKLI